MRTSARLRHCALMRMGACALTLFMIGPAVGMVRAQDDKKEANSRKLLFVSDRAVENAYALYTMNPDGSGQTRITKGAGAAFDPAWSPDHSQIVYSSVTVKEMPTSDLFIMKADGSEPTLLAAGGENTLLTSPTFSPDGKHIAYTRIPTGDGKLNGSIYIMDADGKNKKKLADGLVPTWTPDGKRLLFSVLPEDNGIPALKTMDADGTNVKTLAPKGFGASFSPDGKRIAFVSDGDGHPNVFVMDADGSHATQLTKDADTTAIGPTWTSDGKHIRFSRLPNDNQGKPKLQVCLMDPDGSNVKTLTGEDSFIGVGTSILFVVRAVRK